jgi:hypothetical protein
MRRDIAGVSSVVAGTPATPANDEEPRTMAFQVTDVQKSLKGAEYPASGEQLADVARGNGADDDLVQELSSIGEVSGPDQVMSELSGKLGG